MTDHVQYICPPDCSNPHCQFCMGGLFACKVCGSFEGATTNDCPGVQLTMEQAEAVYAGEIDFRDGHWIDAGCDASPSGRQRQRNDRLGDPCHRCGASWRNRGPGCTVACYRADRADGRREVVA